MKDSSLGGKDDITTRTKYCQVEEHRAASFPLQCEISKYCLSDISPDFFLLTGCTIMFPLSCLHLGPISLVH
ncbi:hypothetical protein CHARACLAT_016975 [Characodon lateralis]|uniref:Uncharacterized protein n=1 Tax=Characodon lateralis TaxID=208331 RepID=A0ABU7F3R4_9TELE|nr:hypothetical protein [Characodon lateralis]